MSTPANPASPVLPGEEAPDFNARPSEPSIRVDLKWFRISDVLAITRRYVENWSAEGMAAPVIPDGHTRGSILKALVGKDLQHALLREMPSMYDPDSYIRDDDAIELHDGMRFYANSHATF